MTVRNVGAQTGTGVVVTDSFDPRLFSDVTASDGGVIDLVEGTITWQVPSLAGNGGGRGAGGTSRFGGGRGARGAGSRVTRSHAETQRGCGQPHPLFLRPGDGVES